MRRTPSARSRPSSSTTGPPCSTPPSSASTSTPGTTVRACSPAGGADRWTALRRQALGDGLLDAAILCRYETFLRPEERRWPDWIEGQRAKFRRALDALEGEAEGFGDTVDIGTISAACAADYLDFRSLDDGWREGRPHLAAWLEGFAARPSMQATRPSA